VSHNRCYSLGVSGEFFTVEDVQGVVGESVAGGGTIGRRGSGGAASTISNQQATSKMGGVKL
jgi:hypothetical protein